MRGTRRRHRRLAGILDRNPLSDILDIVAVALAAVACATVMIKTGRIEFYDRPTAWGLIVGDDQELYVVRGRDGRGLAPRVGERVSFESQGMTDGKRATEVRLVSRGLTPIGREAPAGGVRPLR
jgi:hypothetical protein